MTCNSHRWAVASADGHKDELLRTTTKAAYEMSAADLLVRMRSLGVQQGDVRREILDLPDVESTNQQQLPNQYLVVSRLWH